MAVMFLKEKLTKKKDWNCFILSCICRSRLMNYFIKKLSGLKFKLIIGATGATGQKVLNHLTKMIIALQSPILVGIN